MLIRSQDNRKIVNLNNWGQISVVITKIYAFNDRNHVELGLYSTEEKAIKVLDMIQKAYLGCNCQPLMSNYAFVKNGIFQMPQDSEV